MKNTKKDIKKENGPRDNARDPWTKLVPLSIMWKIRSQGHCYRGSGRDHLINEVTNLALTRFTCVFLCEFFLG